MYVHDVGLTFLPTERAGSRSVAQACRNLGFKLVGDHHEGPEAGHEIVGEPFTVVRNHWDWVASHWWGTHGDMEGPFITTDWIVQRVMGNPGVFHAGRTFRFAQVPGVTILRFENLETELIRFLDGYGLELDTLPHEGASDDRHGRHFTEVYTPHSARFVAWLWYPEIKEFGYRFRKEE